jgi:hypothetical protein
MRCQVLVRATEVVDERSIRRRLLQGVQRRPVDVLQHGMPEQLRVLGRADHRRERTQPGFPSGAPPTLAHDGWKRSSASGLGRTTTGCRMPTTRIEATSSVSASGSNCCRGWRGLGSIALNAISANRTAAAGTGTNSTSSQRRCYLVPQASGCEPRRGITRLGGALAVSHRRGGTQLMRWGRAAIAVQLVEENIDQ